MSRGRKRKSDKGSFCEEAMRRAVKDVIENKKPIRQATREYELKLTTLHRYVAKAELNGLNIRMAPKYRSRQVFTEAEEILIISDFLLTSMILVCFSLYKKQLQFRAYQSIII